VDTEVADGLVAVVKHDCPTCRLVAPVLADLASRGAITVFSQDDPAFPEGLPVVDDTGLDVSFALDIDTVPTLLQVRDGVVVARTEGWFRPEWEQVSGCDDLGPGLPELRPGCGSRTNDPEVIEARTTARLLPQLQARRVELGAIEDVAESMFERGWTDGLPVVPPTPERVARIPGSAVPWCW